jgi:hypothetical protein
MEYELLPSARSIEGILVSYSSYYLLLPSASKQYLHCMAREQPPVSEASMQLASFNPASSQFYLVAVARISSLVSSSARNPKVVSGHAPAVRYSSGFVPTVSVSTRGSLECHPRSCASLGVEKGGNAHRRECTLMLSFI